MCLFLAVLGLRCCEGFSLFVESGGHSLVAVHGLLTAVASLVAELRLWGTRTSVVEAHGLSSRGSWACSVACGILPGQDLNPCLLHWKADSLPPSHQGSPPRLVVYIFISLLTAMRRWQPTAVFWPGESSWTGEPGRLQSVEPQRITTERLSAAH